MVHALTSIKSRKSQEKLQVYTRLLEDTIVPSVSWYWPSSPPPPTYQVLMKFRLFFFQASFDAGLADLSEEQYDVHAVTGLDILYIS